MNAVVGRAARILIVDDDAAIGRALVDYLERQNLPRYLCSKP